MTRSCRTCRWFRPESDGQLGRCANPALEQELGSHVAVRARELHCRIGWGNDRWQAAPDDIVLEIRVKSPSLDQPERTDETIAAQPAERLRSIESIVTDWGASDQDEAIRVDAPRP